MVHQDAAAESWRLTAEGLSLQRGARRVVRDVSLAVAGGQVLSIIGPNGSGKSTLLLGLLGLLPPAAGCVHYGGRDLRRFAHRERARLAAYVPQTLEHVPAMTVWELVAGGRFPHTPPLRPLSQRDRDVIQAALVRCGLEPLADRPMDSLSGGERQKALLAAALAQEPRVLLLDEPTTALDPAHQVQLAGLLHEYHAGGGALIVVSHDLQLPALLGGQVLALVGGAAAASGPARQVLRPDALRGIYGVSFEEARLPSGRIVLSPIARPPGAHAP